MQSPKNAQSGETKELPSMNISIASGNLQVSDGCGNSSIV